MIEFWQVTKTAADIMFQEDYAIPVTVKFIY